MEYKPTNEIVTDVSIPAQIRPKVTILKFRKDINGLRAIAVLAVVLFHFAPDTLPGGFAAVDIFFVISGFLMTRIIFNGLGNNTFHIGGFYKARANRIIPALSVLCLTMVIFGWFYLTPIDYKTLTNDSLNSIVFISNFFYGGDAGYFASSSQERWLLHTWSLSAEWQFYILYPIILVILKRFISFNALKLTVVSATIIGFIYCVRVTYQSPELSYYLLPTRAWEMMIGGVAYLFPIKNLSTKNKVKLEVIGLSLIVFSYLYISKDNPWPGYLALFPVLGTYITLQAQRENSLFTGNIVFQKIGLWSYSIYLWHWPLVVLGSYFSLGENWIYFGIPLSLLLGFLSYQYIEKFNFKSFNLTGFNILLYKPLMLVFLVAIVSGVTHKYFDTESRLPTALVDFLDQSKRPERWNKCHASWEEKVPECTYGDGKLGAIVIGDSHAQAVIGMISRAVPNRSVLDWTMEACATIKGLYEKGIGAKQTGCGDFVNYALKTAKEKYPGIPIIIINRTSQNLYGRNEKSVSSKPKRFVGQEFSERNEAYRQSIANGMIDTACAFTESNPVYIVRPIPELKQNIYNITARALMTGSDPATVSISLDEYHGRQKLAWEIQDKMAMQCGVKIINPLPYLCDDSSCYGARGDSLLYFDDDHLNEDGSEQIGPAFARVWEAPVQPMEEAAAFALSTPTSQTGWE